MPNRYRVLPFSATDVANPADLIKRAAGVEATAMAQPSLGQWTALLRHFVAIGVQTLLVQENVRDPDFLEEYEAFYSRQQKEVKRYCVRIHAFSIACPSPQPTDAPAILDFIDQAAADPTSYRGFTTVRPLRHAPVGASILSDGSSTPVLCKDRFPVHIAGTKFTVEGTPYLQQDNAVGACAQASIWMALRTLRRRWGNSAYSPAELTVSATKYTALNRVFPGRQGLTVGQMLEAVRASNHDPLVVQAPRQAAPAGASSSAADASGVITSAQPYLESGIPVITLLVHPNTGGHVVVAIGLGSGAPVGGQPDTLIMHNDNEGPYLPLPRTATGNHYALDQTSHLIVPMPRGVFMSAAEALTQVNPALSFLIPAFLKSPPAGGLTLNASVRVHLCTRHAFRKWAKSVPNLDPAAREAYRISEMPKMVWVLELHDQNLYVPGAPNVESMLGELVLDAGADVLHGDTLVFMRVTSGMVPPLPTTSAGLLLQSDQSMIALATGAVLRGIAEPWEQD